MWSKFRIKPLFLPWREMGWRANQVLSQEVMRGKHYNSKYQMEHRMEGSRIGDMWASQLNKINNVT